MYLPENTEHLAPESNFKYNQMLNKTFYQTKMLEWTYMNWKHTER